MTRLREFELRDQKENYRLWRHSSAVVEFMYVLALKKCMLETKRFSKVNVYCSDREDIEPALIHGVVDVHLKFDIRAFRGERANLFAVEQIDRAMQMLEAANYLPKGAHRAVKEEVLRTNFEWTGPMSRWIRRGASSDKFRLVASTAHNGIQLDAEFRFANGGKGRLPLLKSALAPDYMASRFEAADWKSAQGIELRCYSDRGSHRNVAFGLRSLDTRGMKDLEAETVKRNSVTFRYSLDRIRPPASKPKLAKKSSGLAKKMMSVSPSCPSATRNPR